MEPNNERDAASSGRQRIDPQTVTKPMQLLAAWLVALIVTVGMFLGGARAINDPPWAAGVLVVAAVAIVPLFLVCLLLLQTRFRAENMEDQFYSEYIREQRQLRTVSHDLAQTLRLTGLDLDGLIFGGRSLQDAPAEAQDQIVSLTSQLREQISHVDRAELQVDPASPRDHPALIAGKALMAEGRWRQAAPYFEQYIEAGYEDWQVYFAIGYCRGKSHDGGLADRAALEAYDHAMRLAPENLSPLARARLTTYRAAMFKRLKRLDEAEPELKKALELLKRHDLLDTDEAHDTRYNLAGVLALKGEEDDAIEIVRALRGTAYAAAIWAHRDDYFAGLKNRSEFIEALGGEFAGAHSLPALRLRTPGHPPEAAR